MINCQHEQILAQVCHTKPISGTWKKYFLIKGNNVLLCFRYQQDNCQKHRSSTDLGSCQKRPASSWIRRLPGTLLHHHSFLRKQIESSIQSSIPLQRKSGVTPCIGQLWRRVLCLPLPGLVTMVPSCGLKTLVAPCVNTQTSVLLKYTAEAAAAWVNFVAKNGQNVSNFAKQKTLWRRYCAPSSH